MAITKLQNLINPEVMADMIRAKLPQKIRVTPFAYIDTTLQGAEGDTKTIPCYEYIGDAEDVAEGVECGITSLQTSSTQVTIKKVMKAVGLTDEAVLSAHGNPVGEATNQLTMAIASKIDNDCLEALYTVNTLEYDGSSKNIDYVGIVEATDLFYEEVPSEKVMFVNPLQLTDLRKDDDFIDQNKYGGQVMMTGEVGKIGGVRIVPSRKVLLDDTKSFYVNPIIKLNNDQEAEEDAPAFTILIKRNINLETERKARSRTTELSVDEIYGVAITNPSKIVLAKFKGVEKTTKLGKNTK